jgi:hypothetical protein
MGDGLVDLGKTVVVVGSPCRPCTARANLWFPNSLWSGYKFHIGSNANESILWSGYSAFITTRGNVLWLFDLLLHILKRKTVVRITNGSQVLDELLGDKFCSD